MTEPPGERYDRRKLSYAGTFPNRTTALAIHALEMATGKPRLLRLIRRFEAEGVPMGADFWPRALSAMGIEIETPKAEIAQIPRSGPLVVVANHPHGLVDGMVLAELVRRRRADFKILARSLLTNVSEIAPFMIPVPFPHEAEALTRNLEARRQAMSHLRDGGAVLLFPAGSVAVSRSPLGPAIEGDWTPFTAKLIRTGTARVLPVRFPGQNSRWYQMAHQVSPILRQGLLLHEVVHALNRPQRPHVGAPVPPETIASWSGNPRGFMEWLRGHTLGLGAGA